MENGCRRRCYRDEAAKQNAAAVETIKFPQSIVASRYTAFSLYTPRKLCREILLIFFSRWINFISHYWDWFGNEWSAPLPVTRIARIKCNVMPSEKFFITVVIVIDSNDRSSQPTANTYMSHAAEATKFCTDNFWRACVRACGVAVKSEPLLLLPCKAIISLNKNNLFCWWWSIVALLYLSWS